MDNATRRQLLEQAKQVGYTGSILDVFQNPQVLDQFVQQQQQVQQQPQPQQPQQQMPVEMPTPPATTPNYKVAQPRQSEAQPLVMSNTEVPIQIRKTGGVLYDKGGPKDKGWKEYKTATNQSFFLDPRFKDQRYYVDEKGNTFQPDQNSMIFDVASNAWEGASLEPTLKISAKEATPALASIPSNVKNQFYNQGTIKPATTGAQRMANQFMYAMDQPLDALGSAIQRGYIPQGNLNGDYETASPMSSVIGAFNPVSIVMDASRVGRDLSEKETYTTLGGAGELGLNAAGFLPFGNILKKGKNYFGNLNFNNQHLKEIQGQLVQGVENQKAIDEGNEWLQNWINHPRTQMKIDADLNPSNFKGNLEYLEKIRNQAKTYQPNVKQYPLKYQYQDLLNRRENIHAGNTGVDYTHNVSANFREAAQNNKIPFKEYGSWVTADKNYPQSNRISTTVHEGTHAWTGEEALKYSKQEDFIKSLYHPKTLEKHNTWQSLRDKNINPTDEMTGADAYMGYLANPTEVHARVMQMRHALGLQPDDYVSPQFAKEIMETLKKNTPDKIDLKVDPKFLDVINHNPEHLSNLFNNLWGVAPVVGAGYLGSQLYQQQKEQQPKREKGFVSFKTGGKKCYTCNQSKLQVLYNKRNYKK